MWLAHALIDAGAGRSFGHSGHIERGIEIYKHRPIMYCTGDFMDDYAVDEIEQNDRSFVFVAETEGHSIYRLLLYPTVIRDFQASRAGDGEREAIVAKMQGLCTQLRTATTCIEKAAYLAVMLSQRTNPQLGQTSAS